MRLLNRVRTLATACRAWAALHVSPPGVGAYLCATAAGFGFGRETVASVGPLPLPEPVPAGLLVAGLAAVAVAILACHGHRQVVQSGARPVWPARALWLGGLLLLGYLPLFPCAGAPQQLVRNYLIFTGLALLASIVAGAAAAVTPVAGYVAAAALFGQSQASSGQLVMHGWALVLDPSSRSTVTAAVITVSAAGTTFVSFGAYLSGRWQPD